MAGKKTTTAVVKKSAASKVTKKSVAANQTTFADYFRFGESYTSLILGIVVVIIASLLLVTLLRSRGTQSPVVRQETSSIATQKTETEEITTDGQKSYVIQKGDDLWKIAQAQYNDGYSWVEIAKANNLSNPSVIKVGTKLVIPNLTKSNLADKKNSDATSNVAMTNVTPSTVATVTPTLSPSPTKTEPTKVMAVATETAKPTPILPPANIDNGPKIASNTYTVVAGDYLWEIAQRAYGDAYKWVDIAKANNLSNPDLIFVGTKLTLPR